MRNTVAGMMSALVALLLFVIPDGAQACTPTLTIVDLGHTIEMKASSTSGTCGGLYEAVLRIYINESLYATHYCHLGSSSCDYTHTLSKCAFPSGTYAVRLTTSCSMTENEQCVSRTAETSGSFTVNNKPSVSVAYQGPDAQGAGSVSIGYSFPETAHSYQRRIKYQVFDATGTEVAAIAWQKMAEQQGPGRGRSISHVEREARTEFWRLRTPVDRK